MKKSVVCIIMLLLASSLSAQRGEGVTIQAYPMLGATLSQIEGDYLKGFKKWGITAGVGAQMYFFGGDRWSLSVEADFAQRGVREYFRSSEIPYQIEGLTLNYVDVPLTFHFKDPWGGVMIGVGMTYSRLINQPHGTISYRPTYVEPDTTDMTFLRNDLAIVGDLRFPIWQRLMLNLRVQYSVIPIKRDWTFVEHITVGDTEPPLVTTNDCYNFSVSLRLTYMLGSEPSSSNRGGKGRR